MRKVLITFLIFVFSCITCCASEPATVFLVETAADSEREISINVEISENSRACGGKIDIAYDNTLLNPEEYLIDDSLSDGMFLINLNYDVDVIRISWAGTDELISGGTMCTITFSVIEDKTFSATIDISQCKLADVNSEPLAVAVKNCEIAYEKESTSSRPNGASGGKNKNTVEKTDNEKQPFKFSDVKETDWYFKAVKFAFEKGITSGVSETLYAPNDKVTRGQFITMLCRAYGIKEMTGENFADCGNTWYTGYLAAAKQLGISNGIGDNLFAPEKEITREEMVALIYNYLKSVGKIDTEIKQTAFADDASISEWAKSAVAFSSSKGYVMGKEDNLFDPAGYATRAELAQVFFNMFK